NPEEKITLPSRTKRPSGFRRAFSIYDKADMKSVLIALFLARFAAGCLLRYLNLRHLKAHGASVPAPFAGAIDAETLARTSRYTLEQSRLALIQSVFDSALLLAFLFTPLLARYDAWIDALSGSFVI